MNAADWNCRPEDEVRGTWQAPRCARSDTEVLGVTKGPPDETNEKARLKQAGLLCATDRCAILLGTPRVLWSKPRMPRQRIPLR